MRFLMKMVVFMVHPRRQFYTKSSGLFLVVCKTDLDLYQKTPKVICEQCHLSTSQSAAAQTCVCHTSTKYCKKFPFNSCFLYIYTESRPE